jgi:hypothetical protein
MDCRHARKHLDRLSLPLDGEAPAELRAAQNHFAGCEDCQAAWEQNAELDRAVSRRMAEIAVPERLADRIRERIAASRPISQAGRPIRRRNRRPWLWSAVAALLILIVCTPVLLWTFSSPTLTLDRLLAAVEQPMESQLERWPTVGSIDVPAGWSAVPQLGTEPFRQGTVSAVPLHAARFGLWVSQDDVVRGVLWALPQTSVSGAADLPPLQGAAVSYGPAGEYLAWRESGVVYVLVLNGHGLHNLQTRLLARRSVT